MKRWVILIVFAMAIAVTAGMDRGFAIAQDEVQEITVTGKIQYMKNLGGYFLMGKDPFGPFIIVNQNPPLLKSLMKANRTMTIDGFLTLGADFLFIERIDGKKYKGKS